jgi:hypothetical protein
MNKRIKTMIIFLTLLYIVFCGLSIYFNSFIPLAILFIGELTYDIFKNRLK